MSLSGLGGRPERVSLKVRLCPLRLLNADLLKSVFFWGIFWASHKVNRKTRKKINVNAQVAKYVFRLHLLYTNSDKIK